MERFFIFLVLLVVVVGFSFINITIGKSLARAHHSQPKRSYSRTLEG